MALTRNSKLLNHTQRICKRLKAGCGGEAGAATEEEQVVKRNSAILGVAILSALGGGLIAQAAQNDHGFLRKDPSEVRFKSALGVGPDQAVLFGDPSKPGI